MDFTQRSSVGNRRTIFGREQVCDGPCRRCSTPVWRYADEPKPAARPAHSVCEEWERRDG